MTSRTSNQTINPPYKYMVFLCFGVVALLLITAFVLAVFWSNTESGRIDLVLNTVLDTLKICVGLFFGLLSGKALP
jgi:hypothetical protein